MKYPFDKFRATNSMIDIHLQIKLSECQRLSGGTKSFEFVRTIKRKITGCSKLEIEKEPTQIEVNWPKKSKCGDQIIIKGLGDQNTKNQLGNLIITIIKDC